jgi:tyrosine-protein phosphatase YwqE
LSILIESGDLTMLTQKITLAAFIGALSATVLASNAHAMTCADMTDNQRLAAIERGQCTVETANLQDNTKIIVDDDKWIRTGQNAGGGQGTSGKAGGGYHY